MTFKEVVAQDMQDVFFNTDEFATEHELEGQIVPLILDEDEIQARKIKAAEGTYFGEILFYIDKKYLSERPVEGQRVSFDSEYYFVVSCKDDGHMYEIAIGANSAW